MTTTTVLVTGDFGPDNLRGKASICKRCYHCPLHTACNITVVDHIAATSTRVFCATMSIVVVHVNDANLFPPCTAARVLFCPSVSIIVADVNYPSPIFFSVMSFIIRTVTLTDLILRNIAKYQNYAVKSR